MSGFVMVPYWLLDKKPTGNDVLVYANLAKFGTWNPGTGRYDECRPSIARICRETDLSESSIRRSLKNLVKLGGIVPLGARYDEDGGQLPTVYAVVFGVVTPPPVTGDSPPRSTGESPGVSPVEPNQEPSTKNQDTKKKPSASPRGTRMTEDWMPSEKTKAWCAEHLPPGLHARAGHHLVKFRNYWLSKSGAGASKIDWERTFQNWMLTEMERFPTSGAPAGSPKPFVQQADEYRAAKNEREDVVISVMQQLMEYAEREHGQELAPSEARRLVNGWIDSGQIGLNELSVSVPSLYSGSNVIDAEAEEVR